MSVETSKIFDRNPNIALINFWYKSDLRGNKHVTRMHRFLLLIHPNYCSTQMITWQNLFEKRFWQFQIWIVCRFKQKRRFEIQNRFSLLIKLRIFRKRRFWSSLKNLKADQKRFSSFPPRESFIDWTLMIWLTWFQFCRLFYRYNLQCKVRLPRESLNSSPYINYR